MLTLSIGATTAWGQVHIGIRGGVTVDPEQIHFGAHGVADIVPSFRFQPNVEIGVGDNLTVIALNPEFTYSFPSNTSVKPYIGGGPGINIFDQQGRFNGTSTEVGINFLFGVELPLHRFHNFLAELKVGAGDSPDLKITAGVTF